MSIKRLTKEDLRETTGVLNPVGHTVLAFKDDTVTTTAATALHGVGMAAEDVLVYAGSEALPRLRERVATASGSAGFGYEITLMRRYLTLAEAGAGWLIVYTPEDAAAERVTEVATRLGALCAVRYHRLANEDLI